ncbi:Potassium-activated aldehyde dehydrogenase [Drechslerella dactyloides]|uniref:aldehyde dehydrogenase (NAD(+)) n=1 Tax=Drechslerella dactyloides TaxID=74499 RepID=A0AAD6NLN0_DREDA|nr:Potassium-activated aldehyde dehydrogenase [Drechslerella dactyloides]
MAELERCGLWISGKERPGKGEEIPLVDPSSGETYTYCDAGSVDDCAEAINVAQAAFVSGVWSKKSRHERADVLERAAALFPPKLQHLIQLEVRQTGRAIREMAAQVPSLVRWFKYYAALLRTEERAVLPTAGKLHNWVDRKPLGVVVQITPFNHPLLIAVKKLAPALAAGNSVVLKPSELTPLTSIALAKLMQEAGLPDGVLSVVPGKGANTGKALVENPLVRKVDVTGSTAAGRAIGEIVGQNLAKYTAELGGKAPLLVFEKADVTAAVNGIAFGSFMASGQTCVAATRILVQNTIFDQVLELLTAKAESIARRMGDPTNHDSMMGPLVSARQLVNVEEIVDNATSGGKAKVVTGGKRLRGTSELDGFDFTKGYFYPPTILTSTSPSSILETRIWKEEAFGPVIVVAGFDTEEEAIALANDSEYGLGAAIWTSDLSQAFRVSEEIDAGIVWINTHHRNDPSSPWGGTKGPSGVGSENGVDAYREYTKAKSTIVNYASSEEMAADDWFREGKGDVRYG